MRSDLGQVSNIVVETASKSVALAIFAFAHIPDGRLRRLEADAARNAVTMRQQQQEAETVDRLERELEVCWIRKCHPLSPILFFVQEARGAVGVCEAALTECASRIVDAQQVITTSRAEIETLEKRAVELESAKKAAIQAKRFKEVDCFFSALFFS